jgi:hypothetical protein
MSLEARIISAIALMYALFGATQYLMTEVFIAPFLLNALLLFSVSNFLWFRHWLLKRKWGVGLFLFAFYTAVNLTNDQWFMAFLLNFENLSEWFNSSTYQLIRVIGVISLIASIVPLIYCVRYQKKWLIAYSIATALFALSLFFEFVLPPEISVFAIGLVAVLANVVFFENESFPQRFFTLNALWFLLALLNFFELLSIGI